MGKWNKYTKTFQTSWLTNPQFGKWLAEVNEDGNKAYCKACRTQLRAHKSDLKKHDGSLKHTHNMSRFIHQEIIFPSRLVAPTHVIASAPSDRNLLKLHTLGVKTTHDNNEVVQTCDVIFLCVKPQFLTQMISELNTLDTGHDPLFISIVTGFDLETLEKMLSRLVNCPRVIRTMPNTPSMVGQGCCLYTLGTHTSSGDSAVVSTMFKSVGFCAEIPEYQMDAACGLAGSGPAYIYVAIEALADGGVKMGLPRQLAQTIAAQMVKGAATMVLESGKHPGQLKDEVCSPGGTTITAMHTLEGNGFRNALVSAVEASSLRSKELGSKK
nr:pyrroline-5-carboxylate reductase 3-like isoform X2 [Procambarus clarkii]